MSRTSQSKAPLKDGSSADHTDSIVTCWYPSKGLEIVELFESHVVFVFVGGHSPCARASALSKGAPDTGAASARIVTSIDLYRNAQVEILDNRGGGEFI